MTLEEQIAARRETLRQDENRLNELLSMKKEKDRKERTHRLCERAGFMESIMPDTMKLTKEKFETFLSQILLNDNAHKILSGLIEGDSTPPIEPLAVEPSDSNIVYTGWQINGGKVVINQRKNSLQVFFGNIPDTDMRSELKTNGFQWVASDKAWELELKNDAIYKADRIQCIQPITGEKPSELQKTVQTSD